MLVQLTTSEYETVRSTQGWPRTIQQRLYDSGSSGGRSRNKRPLARLTSPLSRLQMTLVLFGAEFTGAEFAFAAVAEVGVVTVATLLTVE